MPVCRLDRIARSGDRYATTIAGHPVVAVRDGDDVRVLTNVCQHRWSTVAEPGCSQGRNLVCPYHRWSYGLDGHLQAAPLAGAFCLDDVALPEVRHEVWLGFVMANLDGGAEPLGPSVAGLTEILAPWRVDELVTVASRTYPSTWNWKVMVENWIECYHHIGSHRDTVESRNPARTTRITETDEPWTFMTVDTDPAALFPPEQWSVPMDAEDAGHLTIWAVFPLLLGGHRGPVLVLAGGDSAHRRPPPRHLAPADPPGPGRRVGRRVGRADHGRPGRGPSGGHGPVREGRRRAAQRDAGDRSPGRVGDPDRPLPPLADATGGGTTEKSRTPPVGGVLMPPTLG